VQDPARLPISIILDKSATNWKIKLDVPTHGYILRLLFAISIWSFTDGNWIKLITRLFLRSR
jgi:hypothetical protein